MKKSEKSHKYKPSLFEKVMQSLEQLFAFFENIVNRGIGERFNFFYFLGAIPIVLMFVLLFSGLYLFIYYDLSLNNAYDSVKNISEASLFGNLLRSMHRYAADGMILFAIIHMIRMLVKRFHSNHRWLAWVSGVVLLVLILIQGVTGYILPMDSTANFVMQETAVLLASAQIFGNMLSRSFASPGNSGKWIMWIIMIVHLAIPMLMVFLIFIHVKRVSRAKLFPPHRVTWSIVGLLTVFAIIFPVSLLDRADPYKIAYLQELDWFYLFLTPFMKSGYSIYIWLAFFGVVLLLLIIPWLFKTKKVDYAVLNLENCTGCTLCAQDCPYEAIAMHPREDGKDFKFEARISNSLCSGCGICIGACTYDALNLLNQKVDDDYQKIENLLKKSGPDEKIYLGVVCQKQATRIPSSNIELGDARIRFLEMECVGKFGSSHLQRATKNDAAGVIAYSCPAGDCNFREGNHWFENRMQDTRKPKFKMVKDASPVALMRLDGSDSIEARTKKIVNQFQNKEGHARTFAIMNKRPVAVLISALLVLLTFVGLYFGSIATNSYIPFDDQNAVIRLDFFYMTNRKACDPDALNPEEYQKAINKVTSRIKMDNLSEEARQRVIQSARDGAMSKFCSRERLPLDLKLYSGGKIIYASQYQPSGYHKDGLVYVLHEQKIKSGQHDLKLTISDQQNAKGYVYETSLDLKGGRKFFIDFDKNNNGFIGR